MRTKRVQAPAKEFFARQSIVAAPKSAGESKITIETRLFPVIVAVVAVPAELHARPDPKTTACKFGSGCTKRPNCPYQHPADRSIAS